MASLKSKGQSEALSRKWTPHFFLDLSFITQRFFGRLKVGFIPFAKRISSHNFSAWYPTYCLLILVLRLSCKEAPSLETHLEISSRAPIQASWAWIEYDSVFLGKAELILARV